MTQVPEPALELCKTCCAPLTKENRSRYSEIFGGRTCEYCLSEELEFWDGDRWAKPDNETGITG